MLGPWVQHKLPIGIDADALEHWDPGWLNIINFIELHPVLIDSVQKAPYWFPGVFLGPEALPKDQPLWFPLAYACL